MTNSRCVDIRYEGIVNYQEAVELMKTLQKQRIDEQINDTMLILEHPEIVTIGPRAKNDGITAPPGYETFPVDRGGGLTWHGQGQIVCYPIFKWRCRNSMPIFNGWISNCYFASSIYFYLF